MTTQEVTDDPRYWKNVSEMEEKIGLLCQITDHVICNPEDGPWQSDEEKGRPFDPKTYYSFGFQDRGTKLFEVMVVGNLDTPHDMSATITTYPGLENQRLETVKNLLIEMMYKNAKIYTCVKGEDPFTRYKSEIQK